MPDSPVRWGIGTGRIAGLFAQGLAVVPEAQLVAVGSRTQEAAEAFGERFDVARRHGSYAALAADPEVDVIYVATPHPLHHDNTLLCLRAGKAVLCEKPFALNATEAREMVAAARARGLFLMEAMWSRFYPAFDHLRELLATDALGEVRLLAADLGFRAVINPQGRLFNPASSRRGAARCRRLRCLARLAHPWTADQHRQRRPPRHDRRGRAGRDTAGLWQWADRAVTDRHPHQHAHPGDADGHHRRAPPRPRLAQARSPHPDPTRPTGRGHPRALHRQRLQLRSRRRLGQPPRRAN